MLASSFLASALYCVIGIQLARGRLRAYHQLEIPTGKVLIGLIFLTPILLEFFAVAPLNQVLMVGLATLAYAINPKQEEYGRVNLAAVQPDPAAEADPW